MQITRIRALRGPNLWTRSTAFEAIVHCEDSELLYTAMPGFEERLRARFPTIGTLQPRRSGLKVRDRRALVTSRTHQSGQLDLISFHAHHLATKSRRSGL